MKNLFIAGFVVLAFSYNCFAKWGFVPLDELTKDSDLIVVGTLQSVSEYTENDMDYGEGYIVVEKVIFGNVKNADGFSLKAEDNLQLKWRNKSFIACPRIEHKYSENKKEIWLLTVEGDGTVRADYPGRSRSLEELREIKKLLRSMKGFNKISKTVNTKKTINRVNQTIEKAKSVAAVKLVAVSDEKQYSPLNALIVAFFSLAFYRILYRSRFKIR